MESLKKYLYGLMVKAWRICGKARTSIWTVGKEDPRRIIHAFKVGLSLTLVSLLYLMEPLFKGIGSNAMWAVMTVVVVLEFTAGATLYKGLNRGLGTLVAGSLAFLMEFIATEYGKIFGAIFISVAVFVIGSAATYMRFLPDIKKNYEYGVVIFLLTFNLITVSSYRVDNVLKIAYDRFYTIAIGCGICLVMSLLLFPNWSGEELHNSSVSKLEGLAMSIEACVSQYFKDHELEPDISKEESEDHDPIYMGYKAVLDSKSYDATLAKHASWEPRHSRHCYRYPWQQYVKLGAVLRRFGYTVVALHGCLETEIQTPRSVRALFRDPCTQLAGEVSKALTELADSIRKRRQCSPDVISDNLHKALKDLNTALKSQPRLFVGSETNQTSNMLALAAVTARQSVDNHLPSANTESSTLHDWKLSKRVSKKTKEARKVLRPTLSKNAITSLEFSEALPFAAFASLLVEIVARLDIVIDEVEELGRKANFKEFYADDEITVTCERFKVETASDLKNNLPEQAAE